MKSIKELNEKIWYRFIKVIYIVTFFLSASILGIIIIILLHDYDYYMNESKKINYIQEKLEKKYSNKIDYFEKKIKTIIEDNNIQKIDFDNINTLELMGFKDNEIELITNNNNQNIEVGDMKYLLKKLQERNTNPIRSEIDYLKDTNNNLNIKLNTKNIISSILNGEENISIRFIDNWKLNNYYSNKFYSIDNDIISEIIIYFTNERKYILNLNFKYNLKRIMITLILIILEIIISYLIFFKIINKIFYYIILGKLIPKE